MTKARLTRRDVMKAAAATSAAAALPFGRAVAQTKAIELVHWSWLSASDAEVWQQVIDSFNTAHKDKAVQIKMELIPEEQYSTKLLAATVAGKAPDFGWGTAGLGAPLVARAVAQGERAAADRLIAPRARVAATAVLRIADVHAGLTLTW